jgi:hypothetical protein
MRTLLVRADELNGGFSKASEGRNSKALQSFGLLPHVEVLSLEGCTAQAATEAQFKWGSAKEDSPEHRHRYMKHMREHLPVGGAHVWLDANGEVSKKGGKFQKEGDSVLNVSFELEGVYNITGTTDALLVAAQQERFPLSNIELIVELKKNTWLEVPAKRKAAQCQTIIELVAHGLVSYNKRVVALLTDLNSYYEFYWFETSGSVKYVNVSQVVESAATALKIITGLLSGGAADLLGKRCPIPVGGMFPILEGKGGDDNDRDDEGDDNDNSDGSGDEESDDKRKTKGKRTGKSISLPNQHQMSNSNSNRKKQNQAMTNLPLAESLPGANLLSLLDGTNSRDDLEVAREYARDFLAPRMPGVGPKKPQTGPSLSFSKRPALRELTAANLAHLDAGTRNLAS